MKLAEIIRAPKEKIAIDEWKSGKIFPKHFPLSKARGTGLRLGPDWVWRIVKFTALQHDFRVLIKLNVMTEYYAAILALDLGDDLAVLCHHELHVSHKGWHCHFVDGDVFQNFPGAMRSQGMVAWPTFINEECQVPFNVTKSNALTFAAARYRFAAQGELI